MHAFNKLDLFLLNGPCIPFFYCNVYRIIEDPDKYLNHFSKITCKWLAWDRKILIG